MGLQSSTVTLASTAKPGQPTLLGAAGLHPVRIVVRNRGPLRVWIGTRDDLDPPKIGLPLHLGETYVHDGPDPLYAMLDPAPANLPTVTTSLSVVLLSADPDRPAGIPGAAFPWPTSPTDWGSP